MDRVVPAIIVVALLALFIALMLLSWRKRKRAQSDYAEPVPVPDSFVEVASGEALYLATTPENERFERVAVRGLGFRARVNVVVTDAGIVLPIPGETAIYIPAGDIRSIDTASWTIDRGIEPDGLTVVRWRLGDKILDSYFRFEEPDIFTSAAAALTATTGSDTQ